MAWSRINYIDIRYNSWRSGMKGMDFYVGFEVEGYKGRSLEIGGYFYFTDGLPLHAFDPYYSTEDGCLVVFTRLIPRSNYSIFDDIFLFMPYNQLHLVSGNHELMIQIVLWERSRGSPIELDSSSYHIFRYSK